MPCRPIMSLIATQKIAEDKQINIQSFDDVRDNGYEHFKSGLFTQVNLQTKPLKESKNVLNVGSIYLNDLYDLNLTAPKKFDLFSVNSNDVSVIDMPSIADISENIYREMVKCNFYTEKEYDFVGVELCTPYYDQVGDYLTYVNGFIPKYNFDVERLFKFNDKDTPLGEIGRKATLDNLIQNSLSNTIVALGEIIETNPYSIITNRKIFKHDFEISVPKGKKGKILNGLEKILGYQNPFDFLPKDMFDLEHTLTNSKSGEDEGDTGAERLAIQLAYTGEGQKHQIKTLLSTLKYHPAITDGKFKLDSKQYVDIGGINRFKVIINGDKFNVSYENGKVNGVKTYNKNGLNERFKENTVSDFFTNPEFFNVEGINNADLTISPLYNADSLLGKTERIIYEKYDKEGNPYKVRRGQSFIDPRLTEFKEEINGKQRFISKGDMVTAREDMNIKGEMGITDYTVKKGDFIRVWNKERQHDRINRTISHRTLDLNDKRSVLNDNGMVNYAPTFRNRQKNENIKNYMLSLENLAWSENVGDLPLCEIGKGDVLNNKRGRVMWFPPYDLLFSESISANYTGHNFIGRGEEVYTYNNTKRSGTLSFTMIMDYPNILNKVRGQRTEFWERYFKGDELTVKEAQNFILNNLNNQEQQTLRQIKNRPFKPKKTNDKRFDKTQTDKDKTTIDDSKTTLISEVYFPNEVSDIPDKPLSEGGKIINNAGYQSHRQEQLDYTYLKGVQLKQPLYYNWNSYGLNDPFFNDGYNVILKSISDIINKGFKNIVITTYGYTSKANPLRTTNTQLGVNRAINLLTYIRTGILEEDFKGIKFTFNTKNIIDTDASVSTNTGEDSDRNSYTSVSARKAVAYIEGKDGSVNDEPINSDTDIITTADNFDDEVTIIENPLSLIQPQLLDKLLYTDCDQFEYLETYNRAFFDTISERIKYFSPAYHSMTPQGFHTRLTFLQQCMRQGSSIGYDGVDNISNLAFGKPPICILRVGDFFHTKIVINNLSITYEVDKQITWDLNPEGVGVTPMYCNISLNFDYIGGQSMSAPIANLQNALSFNYYANTEMYDPRADSIIDDNGKAKLKEGLKLSDYVLNTNNLDESVSDYKKSVAEKINVLDLEYKNYITNETQVRLEDRIPKNNTPSATLDPKLDEVLDFLNLKRHQEK